ncbi:MAG TPA: HD domain-containing protein [Anaerolineae bacterium]|nr:HD domain-containing protein [Anaerolineae bacterium]
MSDYLINKLITLEAIIAAWEPPLAEAVYAQVAQDFTGHDFYHCLRVKHLALRIAAGEGLDLEIMTATAYLHDIGRGREFQGQGDHVEFGVAQAEKLLPDVAFPPHKIAAVVGCIAHHEEYAWATSHRPLPEAIRGEILGFQDADRLDAIGAVGLARMFAFGGAYRRPLWEPHVQPGHWEHGQLGSSSYAHLYEKLFKLKDTLNTPTGRQLAASRHAFMERFAEQFEEEWFVKI